MKFYKEKEAKTKYDEYIHGHVSNVNAVLEILLTLDIPYVKKHINELRDICLKHDESKWSDEEYYPYLHHFYPTCKEDMDKNEEFDKAVQIHVRNNKHHWNCKDWVDDEMNLLDFDEEEYKLYIIERICDWLSMAFQHEEMPTDYWNSNKDAMVMPDYAKDMINDILNKVPNDFGKDTMWKVTRGKLDEQVQLNEYLYASDVNPDDLNNSKVNLSTYYIDSDNIEQHNIREFNNIKELFNYIKECGGFRQFTDNGNIKYFIMSNYKDSEFYLERDKIAKGGWKWTDINGDIVGHEYRNVRISESDNLQVSSVEGWVFDNQIPHYDITPPARYQYMYHNTKAENLDMIDKEGLVIGHNAGGYRDKSEEGIWCDNNCPESFGYGGCTITFKVTDEEAKQAKVNNTQYLFYKNIPREDIIFIDRVIDAHARCKVSNIGDFVNKFGEDKVIKIFSKTVPERYLVGILSRYKEMNLLESFNVVKDKNKYLLEAIDSDRCSNIINDIANHFKWHIERDSEKKSKFNIKSRYDKNIGTAYLSYPNKITLYIFGNKIQHTIPEDYDYNDERYNGIINEFIEKIASSINTRHNINESFLSTLDKQTMYNKLFTYFTDLNSCVEPEYNLEMFDTFTANNKEYILEKMSENKNEDNKKILESMSKYVNNEILLEVKASEIKRKSSSEDPTRIKRSYKVKSTYIGMSKFGILNFKTTSQFRNGYHYQTIEFQDLRPFEEIIKSGREITPDDIKKQVNDEDINVFCSCFVKGTKVLMANGKYKQIQNIKIGDKVITHKGNVKEVTSTMIERFNGNLVIINGVKSTPNHPYLVLNGNKVEWKKAKDITKYMKLLKPKTKYGYIYVTTNLINGKKYIGQHHSLDINDNYYGSGTVICEAINKYGINNFKKDLLEWCYSPEELDEREEYYINLYNAAKDRNYYNLAAGGNAFKTSNKTIIHKGDTQHYVHKDSIQDWLDEGYVLGESDYIISRKSEISKKMFNTPEFIAKRPEINNRISKTLKGRSSNLKGTHISDEHKRKISKAQRHKIVSDETRKKMSIAASKRQLGTHLSEKHKKSISESMKKKAVNRKRDAKGHFIKEDIV